jgi:outer membrane protein insertion porin family
LPRQSTPGASPMKLVSSNVYTKYSLAIVFFALCSSLVFYAQTEKTESIQETEQIDKASQRKISHIFIVGNKYVTREAILSFVPFKIGQYYNPHKRSQLIKNIYNGLNRFKNIQLYGVDVGNDQIDLYIKVEEKKLLKEVTFEGNKQLTEKDIRTKIKFEDIPAIDKEELKKYAQDIKKLYSDKGYHQIDIETDLTIDGDQASALFKITEHPKALVKRISFKGNKNVPSKELRNILYTREDWILSFMDKSGSFIPERLDADKHVLEQHYQNLGYLNAKVADIDVVLNEATSSIELIFEIREGERYSIQEVNIPVPAGVDFSEDFLRTQVMARAGNYYSREAIVETLKRLELIWGNLGYIFAHVEPSIQPDEESRTVSLAFHTELGSKVFLNKITIKGNKKTKDKIIRRRMLLEEGDILAQYKMDASKDRIEGLGYFEPRDGVNWKTVRLAPDRADLEMIVKEIKTGRFHVKMGYGGTDFKSPATGISIGAELADTNFAGSGVLVQAEANWAKEEQNFNIHIGQPWLFDRPISGAIDVYHKRPSYDDLRNALPIHEKLTGGALTAGFISRLPFLDDFQLLFSTGVDDVRYENGRLSEAEKAEKLKNNTPMALTTLITPKTTPLAISYQKFLDQEFSPGSFAWVACSLEQDQRNHPMHTCRGHKWKLLNKFAFPMIGSTNGFYKFMFDGVWYTPIIGEYDLVFKLHGVAGFVKQFHGKTVPFGELYNLGGPGTIRGYLFGQVSPKLAGDPIGASKALYINAELIFPITPDFNMKGVFFYDGGSGWGNPNTEFFTTDFISNNTFSYRHAVGVGVRMLNPMPVKIDWGFKLDPRKGEPASEVHFGMTYDW